MSSDWKTSITDDNERLVFEALADDQWDFRTLEGISKSVHLPEDQVANIIEKYQGELVRKSKLPDANGRELFTLAGQGSHASELFDMLRVFTSKTL